MYTVVRLASLHVPRLLAVSILGSTSGCVGPNTLLTRLYPVCSETWNLGKGLTAFEGVLILYIFILFSGFGLCFHGSLTTISRT